MRKPTIWLIHLLSYVLFGGLEVSGIRSDAIRRQNTQFISTVSPFESSTPFLICLLLVDFWLPFLLLQFDHLVSFWG